MAEDKAHSTSDKPADETIKETIESIVIAFILAFVFRAYVVEAFVIPTGSMAPTLLGAHASIICDQCGYHFESDWPPVAMVSTGAEELPRPLRAQPGPSGRRDSDYSVYACPMCRAPNRLEPPAAPESGDRILVHKFLYSITDPQRFDVVVFKNPSLPHQNYIKRLIGLPHENLHLYEGNIYVQPIDPETGEPGEWVIARKPDRPEVQRAVFQPIYHSRYVPLDEGRNRDSRHGDYRWSVPWAADEPQRWDLQGRRSYEYRGDGPGEIRFDFAEAVRRVHDDYFAPAAYAYNQLRPAFGEAIEDVRIAATIEAKAEGASASLSTTARLPGLGNAGERYVLRATLDADGRVSLEAARGDAGEAIPLTDADADALRVGERVAMELWYVDQQASVWIDGRRVLRHDFDAPWSEITDRPGLSPVSLPQIAIGVDRPAVLHDVEVDRDLYYQDGTPSEGPARGSLRANNGNPLHLGADEFFCVGDNGPRSSDGRFWNSGSIDEWVLAQFLSDRLDRGEDPGGVVPREMMMGRAFFVYFPAPYHAGIIPLPNFGDMRFIH